MLTNDYVIDDELVVGYPQSEVLNTIPPGRNTQGIVMRGARGPSDNHDRNVRIIASPRSERFMAPEQNGDASLFNSGIAATTPPPADPTPYGTRSILGISKLVRLHGGEHHLRRRLRRDALRDRRRRDRRRAAVRLSGLLLSQRALGARAPRGEFRPVPTDLRMPPKFETYLGTPPGLHWHGNQDLSNLRFLRCRFETDPENRVNRTTARDLRVTNLVGVLSRAAQSLGVEFRGCVFRGQANPMIHALGSRFSLTHCQFRTRELDDGAKREDRKDPVYGVANGADVFIDNPPYDAYLNGTRGDAAVALACLTARDVFSESEQFLVTFTDAARAQPSPAATVLQNVRHHPPTRRSRPSVYWSGPGRNGCPLILMGCDLPSGGLFLDGGFNSPVLDMGNHSRGEGPLVATPPWVSVAVRSLRSPRLTFTATATGAFGP